MKRSRPPFDFRTYPSWQYKTLVAIYSVSGFVITLIITLSLPEVPFGELGPRTHVVPLKKAEFKCLQCNNRA